MVGSHTTGTVTTNSNTVNFLSDLGMSNLQSQMKFEFVIRPSDGKRIQINVVPYRFDGETTTQRSFRFARVTYSTNERITSKASLNQIVAPSSMTSCSRRNLKWVRVTLFSDFEIPLAEIFAALDTK
jgi:hypothetical protein